MYSACPIVQQPDLEMIVCMTRWVYMKQHIREAIIAHLNCNTIGGGNRVALVLGDISSIGCSILGRF